MTEEQKASGVQVSDTNTESKTFEPRIVAFVCNWCTYAGADLAGTSRMTYEPNVRMIRLPCTGRIDILLILKAFEQGADGVVVSGCHPGDCHYTSGNMTARRRFALFHRLCDYLGIDMERIQFAWISAAEAGKWVSVINNFTEKIRKVGPYDQFGKMLQVEYKE